MDGVAPSRGRGLLSAAGLARLIALEGGEGAGKSSQLVGLVDALRREGREVVATREPGGSDGAEAIRTLLVEGAADRWSATAELFLLIAARADHLERTIYPALARGAVVVSDRFWDSTLVYQGLVGELGLARVEALHDGWLGRYRPGLSVLLDVDATTGLARARGGRFELKGAAFHERVREGYRELVRREPNRWCVVDAGRAAPTVALDVLACVRRHLAASEAG